MNTKTLGKKGENLATLFLILKGYKIIKRNYRTKTSEIDIIARKGDTLVFAEVKTRSSSSFSSAVEAVNKYKQKKIIRGAMSFISKYHEDVCLRFDIIEVYRNKKSFFKRYKINHIPNAYDAY